MHGPNCPANGGFLAEATRDAPTQREQSSIWRIHIVIRVADSNGSPIMERQSGDEAKAFKEGMPDRPLKRFLLAFGFSAPVVSIAAIAYSHASALQAVVAAIAIGCGLGLIAAIGKRPLAWILNFIIYRGL